MAERAVIIGAGPAGLAAARQLELHGITPLVLEKDEKGGLLLNACSVKNYPGVPPGLTGRELVRLFPSPERLETEEVLHLSADCRGGYTLKLHRGAVHTRTVIVASGTKPVSIDLPEVSPERLFYGVKNMEIKKYRSAAVIGGGDAALDYALSLAAFMRVNVYTRGVFRRAAPHLLAEAERNSAVSLLVNMKIPGTFQEDIVVVACGRVPYVGFIHDDLLCSPPENGSFHMCGDCVNGIFRQTSIAVGSGVMAAMKTAAYLKDTFR